MRRPKSEEPKDPKRKLGHRVAADVEREIEVVKPGLDTPYPHIAQMFLKRSPEVSKELSRNLLPHLASRLGVR